MARDASKHKPPSPRISVLIVAYESGDTLARCLTALAAQTLTDFEVIVADNGSTDGAPQRAAAAFPDVLFIDNGANLGFAGGVNRAAQTATGEWLALINPDAYAQADWLERLLAASEAYPEIHCFGSRQLMAYDQTRLDGLGDVMASPGFPFRGGYRGPDPGPTAIGETFSACAGAMLVRTEFFLGLGGFDERLFCYCEDVDFGYRMRLAGHASLVVPDAVVLHEGSAASGGARSEFAVFHGTRNRLWVFVKDTPPLLFWLTLPMHIFTTGLLFCRHGAAGQLGAPWRGLVAGLKGLDVAIDARREAQADRTVGSLAIARAMTWNPLDLFQRRVVIKPVRRSPHPTLSRRERAR